MTNDEWGTVVGAVVWVWVWVWVCVCAQGEEGVCMCVVYMLCIPLLCLRSEDEAERKGVPGADGDMGKGVRSTLREVPGLRQSWGTSAQHIIMVF